MCMYQELTHIISLKSQIAIKVDKPLSLIATDLHRLSCIILQCVLLIVKIASQYLK